MAPVSIPNSIARKVPLTDGTYRLARRVDRAGVVREIMAPRTEYKSTYDRNLCIYVPIGPRRSLDVAD